MHTDHSTFIESILQKKKLLLRYYSKEDGQILERTCAAMDYGPSRHAKNKSDRYHFWDYDSDTECHPLSLPAEQISSISLLEAAFEPAEFVTWNVATSPWYFPRDWGVYS